MSARTLGIIDVGTNSIHLVIGRASARRFRVLVHERAVATSAVRDACGVTRLRNVAGSLREGLVVDYLRRAQGPRTVIPRRPEPGW